MLYPESELREQYDALLSLLVDNPNEVMEEVLVVWTCMKKRVTSSALINFHLKTH